MGKLIAIEAKIEAGFKQASEEREAIRKVIDDDTATYDQVNTLSTEVRNLTRAVNKAGIPT